MKYESRADLLIAAGQSLKIQEEANIEPKFKWDYTTPTEFTAPFEFLYDFLLNDNDILENDIYFPVAVVEGKPVFINDELWDINHLGRKLIITNSYRNDKTWIESTSWNPPKPKTVMVELSIADAKRLCNKCITKDSVADACRKALKALE